MRHKQRDLSDSIFEVGDNPSSTKKFYVVSALFAAHSQVFESMLFGHMAEAQKNTVDDSSEESKLSQELDSTPNVRGLDSDELSLCTVQCTLSEKKGTVCRPYKEHSTLSLSLARNSASCPCA